MEESHCSVSFCLFGLFSKETVLLHFSQETHLFLVAILHYLCALVHSRVAGQVLVPVSSVKIQELNAAFRSTFDMKGTQIRVWTFAALPFHGLSLKWVRVWKHVFSSKLVDVSGKNVSPGSSLRTDEVCLSSAMLDSVMCWKGLYGGSLARSNWLWATWQSLLWTHCWWTQRLEGWAPHQLLLPPFPSPDVRQARAFPGCAHHTFLPLPGIRTCIVQFCCQNIVSWFWRIYKACSKPALGPVNRVCLSASRITGWSCISSHAEVFC